MPDERVVHSLPSACNAAFLLGDGSDLRIDGALTELEVVTERSWFGVDWNTELVQEVTVARFSVRWAEDFDIEVLRSASVLDVILHADHPLAMLYRCAFTEAAQAGDLWTLCLKVREVFTVNQLGLAYVLRAR